MERLFSALWNYSELCETHQSIGENFRALWNYLELCITIQSSVKLNNSYSDHCETVQSFIKYSDHFKSIQSLINLFRAALNYSELYNNILILYLWLESFLARTISKLDSTINPSRRNNVTITVTVDFSKGINGTVISSRGSEILTRPGAAIIQNASVPPINSCR